MSSSTPDAETISEDQLWLLLREKEDQEARLQLINHYMPLARKIAAHLFSTRPDNEVEFCDYLQYANVGLLEAVDRYELNSGATFSTYASYRIRGSVLNGLAHVTERREQGAYRARLQRERLESLDKHDTSQHKPSSFEALAEVAIGLALGYMLEDSGMIYDEASASTESTPYTISEFDELVDGLHVALDKLPERENMIIRYHYFHHVDFETLGEHLNVSKGRVSQLHKRAIEMIRSELNQSHAVDQAI